MSRASDDKERLAGLLDNCTASSLYLVLELSSVRADGAESLSFHLLDRSKYALEVYFEGSLRSSSEILFDSFSLSKELEACFLSRALLKIFTSSRPIVWKSS